MSVIGIDLGGTNVRVGRVEGGRLVCKVGAPISSRGDVDTVLGEIFQLVQQVIDERVQGIGVGVPSVVDVERGVVYDVQNIPSWREVPLKHLLEERFHVGAYINNDANCFAVGEKYFGAARDFHHIVGLIVGTGLGAGLIVHDRLYSGVNCGAGEFGMIPYLDHNLEYYACGQFFRNVYGRSGENVADAAARGDLEALAIFTEFGRHLGRAVKTILYAMDPEIIVMGGSVSRSRPFFQTALAEELATFAYGNSLARLRIEVSTLADSAILGAAALFYDARGQRPEAG